MNARLKMLAAALAAAAITTAFAQADNPSQLTAQIHGTAAAPSDQPQNLVAEPTASLSRADGPGADVGKQLMDEINADDSLKGSKVTVQPEEGAITLSGSTNTRAQMQKIAKMAADKVGVAKVTNAIVASEMYVEVAPPQQTAQADTGETPADAGEAQAPAQEAQALPAQ